MNENVTKFFELYASDAALQKKIADGLAAYPGSLEIRESVATNVLLPIAKEAGFEFTINDLLVYENNLKINRAALPDEEYFGKVDETVTFWLLDTGWSNDEAKFCGDK